MPRLLSVGTAVPPYPLKQEEAQSFARELFQESLPRIERLLPIFRNAAIRQRWLSRPKEWFEQPHPFSERNEAYVKTAVQLGEKAIRRCLEPLEIAPQEVDHIILVSTSGLATPSLDARLINQMGMSAHVKRTPIWGLGCAGGAAGLARAYEYARAFPDETVLLVAVELCSLTFRQRDRSKSNLVASSLFGDGAAAALVAGETSRPIAAGATGPLIVDAMSTIWQDSLDVMGWDVTDDGLQVIFSRDIPAIVKQEMQPVVERFLDRRGLTVDQVERYIAHPGGAKVLHAYEETLGLSGEAFRHAKSVLEENGNMSSATVLFVLEKELEEMHHPGTYGLVTALGPGFSSEMLLLRW
jgi:alkylresorcinol/alkylpyrone synthase